jgi:hypothetical protein
MAQLNTSTSAINRVARRATAPYEEILLLYSTFDYDPWIHEHKKIMNNMLRDPYNTYIEFKQRLVLEGINASFPEFKGVIGYLIKSIFQNKLIMTFYNSSTALKTMFNIIIDKIITIHIDSRYLYPYGQTIYIIEDLVALLDIYSRSKEKYSDLYHYLRYRVYLDFLINNSVNSHIVFPTIRQLGATDLIKLRSVPILLLGVTNKPILADQYINTPLDFFAHDIQHARRQLHETLSYYDRYVKHSKYYTNRSPFDIITIDQFYSKMTDFTKIKILPLITIDKQDSQAIIASKQMYKIIIFEIIHEKAWPITKQSICRCIPLLYDTFPIETLMVEDNNITTYDEIFHDPTTLSNIRGKLRYGFYDDALTPNEKIILTANRTSRYIATTAHNLLIDLHCENIPSLDDLLSLVIDPTNADEFSGIPEIDIPDDPPMLSIPTDETKQRIIAIDRYNPTKMKKTFDTLDY